MSDTAIEIVIAVLVLLAVISGAVRARRGKPSTHCSQCGDALKADEAGMCYECWSGNAW